LGMEVLIRVNGVCGERGLGEERDWLLPWPQSIVPARTPPV